MRFQSMHRPSPAMVVAMLALFVAIGGTAAGLPGQNKVNSGDVKNETLKTEDLKDDEAVQSSDVIDGTLETEDIDTQAVTNGKIAFNAVNTFQIVDGQVFSGDILNGGVAAADLGAGSVGSGALAPRTAVFDDTPVDFGDQAEGNNDYDYGTSTASCTAGTTVIGGGGEWVGAGNGGAGSDELQAITESQLSGNGWTVTAVSDVDDQDFRAFALCLGAGA